MYNKKLCNQNYTQDRHPQNICKMYQISSIYNYNFIFLLVQERTLIIRFTLIGIKLTVQRYAKILTAT